MIPLRPPVVESKAVKLALGKCGQAKSAAKVTKIRVCINRLFQKALNCQVDRLPSITEKP